MFSAQKLIFLVSSKSLSIIKGRVVVDTLAFSPLEYANFEVFNLVKFREQVEEFFAKLKLGKNKAVIVLGNDVIFQKRIASKEASKDIEEGFFQRVPISPEKLSKKIVALGDELELFAANRELFSLIIDAAAKAETEIISVVPLGAFGISGQEADEVAKIFDNEKLLKISDFLLDGVEITDNIEKKVEGGHEKRVLKTILAIVFVIAAVSVLGFLIYSRFLKKPQTVKTIRPLKQANLEASPAAATDSAPLLTRRQDVNIEILNGSGVIGQEGRIENKLRTLGYSQITTGNAASVSTVTRIEWGKLSDQIRNEISSELKIDFTEIVAGEATEGARFDVVISTGKPSS